DVRVTRPTALPAGASPGFEDNGPGGGEFVAEKAEVALTLDAKLPVPFRKDLKNLIKNRLESIAVPIDIKETVIPFPTPPRPPAPPARAARRPLPSPADAADAAARARPGAGRAGPGDAAAPARDGGCTRHSDVAGSRSRGPRSADWGVPRRAAGAAAPWR